MNLITCKNISFVYDGVPAVKDLDFSVEPNDYLCIVGENGAGKSTLVKGLLIDNAVTITCEVIVTAQSLIKGGDFTVA